MEKKICVVGLGGVGGLIGGALAHNYETVYFYVRGDRLASIRDHGLKVVSNSMGEFTAYPKLASDDAVKIGVMDVVILAVKHFSLEQVCREIKPLIGPDTVVIPLLNGANTGDKVRALLNGQWDGPLSGQGLVLDALIYIITESTSDFSVRHQSPYANIHIGVNEADPAIEKRLEELQAVFEGAGITCKIEEDIEAAVWRKYILNCAYNVITAYYSANTADLRSNPQAIEEFKTMLEEGCLLARTKGIQIAPNLEDQLLTHVLTKQDPASTSSLNRDFLAGRENELEIFSGELLAMASEVGLELPMTQRFYQELSQR